MTRTIIIPNSRIAARWQGALEVRLRHSPLEAFMRARGLKWAVAGDTPITDNLASATIHTITAAIERCSTQENSPLSRSRHAAVGELACSVCCGYALLIREPTYWRTSALVATARLLEAYVGLSAAAHLAAAAARDYAGAVNSGTLKPEVLRIGYAARKSAETNDADDAARAIDLVCVRLAAIAPMAAPESPFRSAIRGLRG